MAPAFDLGIRARWLLPMARMNQNPLENQFIGISKGQLTRIAPFEPQLASQCKDFWDLRSHAVLPGLINAHTHLPMTLLRGIEDDLPLKEWLFKKIFPLETQFMNNEENVRIGTRLAALECARFGVTTVADMYFFVDAEASEWEKTGLRGLFCQPFLDFPTPEDAVKGSDKIRLFLENFQKWKNHSHIRIGLAPHAPYSCSDTIFESVRDLSSANNAFIHTHLQETQGEVEDSVQKLGVTPTERLARLGVFSSRTLCAHGVHLSDSDQDLLAKNQSSVVYNPDSNMKLASGAAPIPALLKKGVTVALGTDGSASNNSLCLFSAMNSGAKLQKVSLGSTDVIRASEMLWIATRGGAKALGWENSIGSLEEGKRADLIAVDFSAPHLMPFNDIVSHLVYSVRGQDVSHTVVDGKVLMKNKDLSLPWTLDSLEPDLNAIAGQIKSFLHPDASK